MYGEFSFFSFNKVKDWEKGCFTNLTIEQHGISINQTEKYGIEKIIDLKHVTGLSGVLDFTVGKNGRIYLLDDYSKVWGFDPANNHRELLINSDVTSFSEYSSLSSYKDLLFIADPKGSIHAFALSNGQIVWERSVWESMAEEKVLVPLAIKVHTSGFLFCLVPVLETIRGNIVPKDIQLAIIKMNLAGMVVAVYTNHFLKLKRDIHLLQLKYQYMLAISKDGEPYLFDKQNKLLYSFHSNQEQKEPILFDSTKHFSGFSINSKNAFLFGDGRTADSLGEDDRFIMIYNQHGQFQTTISSYRGRVDKMEVDEKDRIYIWDRHQHSFTILRLNSRTMERQDTKLLEGTLLLPALDTKKEKTVWHKVLLERTLPKETQIYIYYYVSDSKEAVVNGKKINIDEIIKDETKTFLEKEQILQPLWQNHIFNPKDALFFNAKGRYIWLKIHLVGTEKETPKIHKLRVYFPRMSYLSYLPAVYQEDPTSSEFLERFLSIFSTFLMDMEEQIDNIPNYFNPNFVSGDFLRWLSSWLGIAADESWSDEQIKLLMKNAPFLYKKRGTRLAIEKIVEIYTGEKPYIIESFQLKADKRNSQLSQVLKKIYGDHPYYFYVLIKPNTIKSEKERIMLQKILDEEKPAFTEAKLIVLEPWIYLDMHSYLNINTYLTERSLLRLNDHSYLPSDTVIIDVDQDNRMDLHTRIELDAKIE